MEEGTLLFRHLPAELSVEERKNLLHYLGATRVKVMGQNGRMKNTAFAVFPSKEQAMKILKQLHQEEFLGSKLIIEFAKKELDPDAPSVVDNEGTRKKEDPGEDDTARDSDKKLTVEPQEIKFDSTFNIWGLKHPRRPDLHYVYPPPTPSILTNIMHALAAVPKFYVQVLHLMNKMDLPAPFGAITPAPPVYLDVTEPALPDNVDQREMDISSESESELESGEEDERERRLKEDQSVKRPARPQRKKPVSKRPRLSDLQDIGIPVQTSAPIMPVTEVFEQAAESAGTRKIELKLPSAILPSVAVPPPPPIATALSAYEPVLPLSLAMSQPERLTTPVQSNVTVSQAAPPLPVPVTTITQSYPPVPPPASSLIFPPLPPPLPPQPSEETLYQQQPQVVLAPVQAGEEGEFPLEKETQEILTDQTSAPKSSEVVVQGGFGILEPVHKDTDANKEEESTEREWTRSKFITSSELRKSRLSHSEMKELNVFRRYDEGEPSCRLYIKNVAKPVTEEDMHWIYGRYVNWDSEQETNIFDIRLMKEGRMKGQAFVTLPTEEAAQAAVKETNGFVLKEKPLVVQFARSAKVREDDTDKSKS